MSSKIFSLLWKKVEEASKSLEKEWKENDEVSDDVEDDVEDEESDRISEEMRRRIELEFPPSLLEECINKIKNAPEKIKDPVTAMYDKLVANTEQIDYKQESHEIFSQKNPPNLPIVFFMYGGETDVQFLSFRTIRNKKTVQVDIVLQKVRPQFYDEEAAGGSDKYFLEIHMHKRLVNPRKFQEEFSAFLASGNHLIKFIFETVWPHIDEAVERDEQKAQQRKLRRENQKKVPRENHPRYSLRARKIDEKKSNSRENQRSTIGYSQ